MENIELTEEEQIILEKRGFYVKKNYTFRNFLTANYKISLFLLFIGTIATLIIPYVWIIFNGYLAIFYATLSIIFGYFFLRIFGFIRDYFRSGKIFYSNDRMLSFGSIFYETIQGTPNGIRFFDEFYKKITTDSEGITHYDKEIKRYAIFLWIILIPTLIWSFGYNNIYFILKMTSVSIISWILFLEIGRHLYQSLHPLYAFGNLGEKIQSLTPQIEVESKGIKEEFKNTLDIDYKTLHHSFDTLSHTFEKIASLVIRLEKIEHRANKGNLFDSQKYIGSLKNDILTPLSSLSTFLGEKETELRAKQEELSKMRVQVGGSDESLQTTLTRVRIEPLIEEIGRQRASIGVMMEHVARL